MKNNKMMRAASGLMIAALLTTGMISGTFAKYITQDELNDSARVAKWGVNLGISGNLYGEAYDGTNNTIVTSGSTATVQSSSAGEKVVAPGTKNADSGLHITLNGKPEVSTKVYGTVKTQNIYLATGEYGVMVKTQNVTAEDFAAGKKYYTLDGTSYKETSALKPGQNVEYFTLEDVVNLNATYYPVVYNGAGVTGTNNEDSLSKIGASVAEMLKGSAVSAAVPGIDGVSTYEIAGDIAKVYEPNTNLATTLNNMAATNITWEWSFSGNNEADTILGDLIASNAGTASNVVYKDTSDYKSITVDGNTGLATVDGSTTPVASTKTSFDITLTVEQAD